MRLLVEVTAEDIANGIRQDSCDCPVARALKRAGVIDDFLFDGEGGGDAWSRARLEFESLYDEGERLKVAVPIEAGRFAERFDNGDHVEPFSFELDIPDEAVLK